MENELWQHYLDSATSGIRDKKTKAEVREELLDHLEDRKDCFLRFNMSEEEAEEKAVGQMGDSEKLSAQLAEVHSKVPVEDLYYAMAKIFWGFLFTFFTIKFGGIDVIRPIGSLLIFMGMYQLRRVNPKLKKAWTAEMILAVWSIITKILPAIPSYALAAESGWIYAITAVGFVINIVRTALLFLGLDDLCLEVYKNDKTKIYEPRTVRALYAYVIIYVITFFAVVFEFAYAMFAIVPFMIYILYQLRKTHMYLYLSKYRAESIEKFGKRGAAAVSGLIVLLLVSCTVTMYAVVTPKVKAEIIN